MKKVETEPTYKTDKQKQFRSLLAKRPVPTVIKLLEQAQTATSPYRNMSDLFDIFLRMGLTSLDGRGLMIEQTVEGFKANPELQAQIDPAHHLLFMLQYSQRLIAWHKLIEGLSQQTLEILTQALAVLAFHARGDYQDYLGEVYMMPGQANKWAGQFFTPWEVARVMSEVSMEEGEGLGKLENWPKDKPLTVHDPCCGSGVMLLAAASVVAQHNPGLIEGGWLELYGQDIDQTCVLMAQLNLKLHGLDGWTNRVRREQAVAAAAARLKATAGSQPAPASITQVILDVGPVEAEAELS